MRIELKNVKYAAFASEETLCFEATVYLYGKKEGNVSNDGRGGCHRFDPWSVASKINEYAKTLPKIVTTFGDSTLEYQPDADSLVSQVLEDVLTTKDLKKLLSKHIVYMGPKGEVFQAKRISPPDLAGFIARGEAFLKSDLKTEKVLNILPFDEALKLFRSAPSA